CVRDDYGSGLGSW
nr:immunoglobulin heavy chain junction region [Macaca mulatta]MOX60875.1 immunoglobulin heavy chain junction region [Macaca mulatta]MOX61620.1 immunoglobulin heavy chain junction region [Macaca mulatta]MOX63234.1 immunoglobulin heavy chain junction region [Macaca mulatta]MOX64092.1 immunoglobulin heavy chain junction region [Macaca mulatta]